MATYQADITRNIEPAMANPDTLTRGMQAQAQGFATAIKAGAKLGYDIYKDTKTEALRGELQSGVNQLQSEMDAVKVADITAKTIFQQERKDLPNLVDEYRAASLLSGTDPEEAKKLAQSFATQKENEIVARYRAEQQRLTAARDAMPSRYNEFMIRSEKTLKNYIATHPMLADEFRSVSQEVTGKRGIELYSVGKLYEDVNYIEKQQAEAAKRQEQFQQALQNAYVDDRVKGGASKTQALQEFNSVEPSLRTELANASVDAGKSKEEAKQALELGGNNILNYSNITVAGFQSDLLAKNASTYAQLSALGVSRSQIASGTIPEAIKNSPAYKSIVDKAGTEVLQLLDVQYNTAVQELNKRARTTPVDADKVKTAMSVLDDWYTKSKEFYTKNPTSFMVGMATKDDRESSIQRRLNIVDTMVRSLGIPADVVAQLGMSGDSAGYSTARAKYPRAAAIIDHANRVREAILAGVSSDEFVELMGNMNKYKESPVAPIPASKTEATASLATHKQKQQKVVDVAQGTQSTNAVQDVADYVISALQQPANAEQFLKTGTVATKTVISKMSESDRKAVTDQVNLAANQYIYGTQAHGDKAKQFVEEYKKKFTQGIPGLNVEASKVVFADVTGSSELKVVANRVPRTGLSPVEQRNFDSYNRVAIKPVAANNALSAVDEMLRVQSEVTGVPIQTLRKDFITAFDSGATVSEGRTKPFVEATAKEDSKPSRITNMRQIRALADIEGMTIDDVITKLESEGVVIMGD